MNEYAFPCAGTEGVNPESLGMTLRDYFAAKAMLKLCWANNDCEYNKSLARSCYQIADAMLKAREAK